MTSQCDAPNIANQVKSKKVTLCFVIQIFFLAWWLCEVKQKSNHLKMLIQE